MYGFEIPIVGLRTLDLVELIQYFLIKNLNIDEIVKEVIINPQLESDAYIRLINRIYLYQISDDVIFHIKQNITSQTDISILSPEIQNKLRL